MVKQKRTPHLLRLSLDVVVGAGGPFRCLLFRLLSPELKPVKPSADHKTKKKREKSETKYLLALTDDGGRILSLGQ
jgi:hypothetical protein